LSWHLLFFVDIHQVGATGVNLLNEILRLELHNHELGIVSDEQEAREIMALGILKILQQ